MYRILIIDDHEVVRDGVKRILEGQFGEIVFGDAGTASEALSLMSGKEWDAVVLDPSLAEGNGLHLIKELKQARPKVPVLVMSRHSDVEYARRAFKAGAAGYLAKRSPRAELVNAVSNIIQGRLYVSPSLAEALVLGLQTDLEREPHHALSDREFEVLCLLAAGKTVAEIAETLALSGKTISTYRARILEKMRMKTNADMIRYAIRHHLIA